MILGKRVALNMGKEWNKKNKYGGKITKRVVGIWLEPLVLAQIDDLAERSGKSRSAFIREATQSFCEKKI